MGTNPREEKGLSQARSLKIWGILQLSLLKERVPANQHDVMQLLWSCEGERLPTNSGRGGDRGGGGVGRFSFFKVGSQVYENSHRFLLSLEGTSRSGSLSLSLTLSFSASLSLALSKWTRVRGPNIFPHLMPFCLLAMDRTSDLTTSQMVIV